MEDTLPVYPDLNALADISSIEDKCRKASHLDPNESLLDRIKLDEENLKKYGLTRGDIFTNHWNMYMKVYNPKNKEIKYDKHANELFEKLPPHFGIDWSPWDRVTKNINLNGQNLRVTYITWGGAEQCPIEMSFSDKYHGYERGDRDWFVSNLDNNTNMWIPDLLPSQIGMFGFFQSMSSPYRFDLEKYVKLMNLTGPVSRLESYKEKLWSVPSGPFGKKFIEEKSGDIIKEIDNEIYHAFLVNSDNNNEELFVMFKDTEWVKRNPDSAIDIFDLPFNTGHIFNLNGYLQCNKRERTILVESDITDQRLRELNKIPR